MSYRKIASTSLALWVFKSHFFTVYADGKVESAKGLVGSTEQYISGITYKGSSGFYVIYNNQTRNPLYVVEKLARSAVDDNVEKAQKRPPFHPEQTLDELFRINPKDYSDSKYDRGHMAPAADFQDEVHSYNATFTMANISPQAPMLNKGFWAKFEAWIRAFLLKYVFDEVMVITGPVFAPAFINNQWIYLHRTIGTFPKLISVPSHYFKVIVGRKPGSKDSNVVAAFLVPNINHVPKEDPVRNYLIRMDQLESILGYRILPTLLSHNSNASREYLDSFVPVERDLALLLNVQTNMLTGERQAVCLEDIGQPSNTLFLPPISKGERALAVKSNNKQGVLHLCECIDCYKSMFGK